MIPGVSHCTWLFSDLMDVNPLNTRAGSFEKLREEQGCKVHAVSYFHG
jgi:hypothetical protein